MATQADEDLLSHLKMMLAVRASMSKPEAFHYQGHEDFLLQHGRFYAPMPYPATWTPGIIKECYNNSYALARRRKNLHYVEGVAFGVIPVDHAWCVDAEGNVYDSTWATREVGMGTSYFGVELDLREVAKTRRRGTASLLHDWHRDYPALRGVPVLHPAPFRRP